MDCNRYEEILKGTDKDLSEGEVENLNKHYHSCKTCREKQDQEVQKVTATLSLIYPEGVPGFPNPATNKQKLD